MAIDQTYTGLIKMADPHGEQAVYAHGYRGFDQPHYLSPTLCYGSDQPELSLSSLSSNTTTQSISANLQEIRRLLISLPTKADLQAVLDPMEATRGGALGAVEEGRRSGIYRQDSIHQAVPGSPAVFASSVSGMSAPQSSELTATYSTIPPQKPHTEVLYRSLSTSGSLAANTHSLPPCNPLDLSGSESSSTSLCPSLGLRMGTSRAGGGDRGLPGDVAGVQCVLPSGEDNPHPLILVGLKPGQISGEGRGADTRMMVTTDCSQYPQMDGGETTVPQTGALVLSSTCGLSTLKLPAPPKAAIWKRVTFKPTLLKLREAGATYRWGCPTLYLPASMRDGLSSHAGLGCHWFVVLLLLCLGA